MRPFVHPAIIVREPPNSLSAGFLPGSKRTKIFFLQIAPKFGDIFFKSPNGNKIQANLVGSFSSGKPVCYLTDGQIDYAKTTKGFGLNEFIFELHDLNIPSNTMKNLFIECDTTSANADDG